MKTNRRDLFENNTNTILYVVGVVADQVRVGGERTAKMIPFGEFVDTETLALYVPVWNIHELLDDGRVSGRDVKGAYSSPRFIPLTNPPLKVIRSGCI